MKTHVRAAFMAAAGAAFLAASVLTAAPALAAGTVLSPETCAGEVFSMVKNVKTCTAVATYTGNDTYTYNLTSRDFVSTFEASEFRSTTIKTVRTQKGKGPIRTTETILDDTYTRTLVPGSEECKEFVVGVDGIAVYETRPVADCEALGLYDLS